MLLLFGTNKLANGVKQRLERVWTSGRVRFRSDHHSSWVCLCVCLCVCVRDVRMRESFPIQNYRIVYFSDDKSCESAIRNRLNYSLPQKAFNCWLPFSFSFSAPLFTHLFAFFHFVRNFMLLYHKNEIDTQAVWNAIESRMNERHCIMLPFV